MNEDLRDLQKDGRKKQKQLVSRAQKWTTEAPNISPEGITTKWTECLLSFFFFPNFDHFISPSNNPVSVVLVFSLFYQCYGCTENSSNLHKLTWLANFKACIWTPIWMPLWVVLLNTTLNSLTEESIQRVYPDNSRARTTIHFKASPRLV